MFRISLPNTRSIVLLTLSVMYYGGYAQKLNLDSLKQVWYNESEDDTTRLQAIQKIAWDVFVYTAPDSTYHYAQIQFDFAERKELKEQMALALHTQGTVWSYNPTINCPCSKLNASWVLPRGCLPKYILGRGIYSKFANFWIDGTTGILGCV